MNLTKRRPKILSVVVISSEIYDKLHRTCMIKVREDITEVSENNGDHKSEY